MYEALTGLGTIEQANERTNEVIATKVETKVVLTSKNGNELKEK